MTCWTRISFSFSTVCIESLRYTPASTFHIVAICERIAPSVASVSQTPASKSHVVFAATRFVELQIAGARLRAIASGFVRIDCANCRRCEWCSTVSASAATTPASDSSSDESRFRKFGSFDNCDCDRGVVGILSLLLLIRHKRRSVRARAVGVELQNVGLIRSRRHRPPALDLNARQRHRTPAGRILRTVY